MMNPYQSLTNLFYYTSKFFGELLMLPRIYFRIFELSSSRVGLIIDEISQPCQMFPHK